MLACSLTFMLATIARLGLRPTLPLTLPFDSSEAMAPGETRELHVYHQALADLLELAGDHAGLFAQLLLSPEGTKNVHTVTWSDKQSNHQQVAAWFPLLHVMELRDPWQVFGWTEEDPLLLWAEVRCIGRVMLQGDGTVVSLDAAMTHASFASYADRSLRGSLLDEAERAVHEVEELRRACFASEVLLVAREGGSAIEATPDDGEAGQKRLEAARRLRAEPPARLGPASLEARALAHTTPHRTTPHHTTSHHTLTLTLTHSASYLQARVAAARATLQWKGLDAPPASTLAELHALWNVRSEREASLQLASYSACGWLEPPARMKALQARSTLERLRLVGRELELVQKTQRAKLALQQLGRGESRGALE